MFRQCLAAVVALTLSSAAASAAIIDYDASVRPNQNPYAPLLTTIVFSGTGWSSDGNVLTINTAAIRGIWFGWADYVNDTPAWTPASNATGNYTKLVTRFSSNATEWSNYLHDGTRGAALLFSVRQEGATEWVDVKVSGRTNSPVFSVNNATFHTYEFWLKNDTVTYAIDGQVVYTTEAFLTSSRIWLVGDGSGSTPGGTGSMYIDHAIYDSPGPAIPVPEPASALLLLAATPLLMLRRR